MENKDNPGDPELEKARSHISAEISEYMSSAVVSTTIMKNSTGNIRVMSFDNGEGLPYRTQISPFAIGDGDCYSCTCP
jgi:type III secretory pathway component EscU